MSVPSAASELLPYKFFAPPSYPGAICREQLLQRMFREPRYGLVVVQAPAGHGKSTLLQQAKTSSEQRGLHTGWLSFDEADNDLRRFTVHMQALVERLGPGAADAGASAGRQRLADQLAARLVRFDVPVHLFLDEFQGLSSRNVLNVFRDLLEHIPDNVTLFIGSRALPEIGLARLLVNNQALVLRADDLRFSPDEAQRFFLQSRELQVNPTELETIYRQTEGWPAALQLYRLSLASPSVRRALTDLGAYKPRELAEYLTDNVLSLQTPRVQEFLRLSSVLTRLSAPLCDYVTGWQDSQSILLFLERTGMFLRCLDSDLCWFKYHTLFSSFLAEQARSEQPDALTVVHQRAADWFHAHGMHEDAMHHAIAARNYAFATDIMNVWADRLIADANLVTMERWSDNLPLDEIAKRPDLAVKIAWALIFLRRHHKLRPILGVLESVPADGPDTLVVRSMLALVLDDMPQAFGLVDRMKIFDQQPSGFRAFELGAAANLSGYRAFCAGDFETAREHLNVARGYSTRGDAAFSGGYSVAISGMNLVMQGRLPEALARFRTGLGEYHLDMEKPFASGALVSNYISALYEANDLDLAESMFTQFHDVICDGVLLDFMVPGYIAMARIQDLRGRPNRTEEILAEAEQIAHAAGWPRLMRIVSWERVRRLLLAGEIDRAQVIASRIPRQPEFALPEGSMIYTEAAEGDAIGAIRVALHGGHPEAALSQLAGELAIAQRQGRSYRHIKLLVLEALAQQARGSDNAAQRSLHRALQLAEPGGFIRLFLDDGDKIIPLLRTQHAALASETMGEGLALRSFVGRLLDAAGQHTGEAARPPGDTGFQPLEPLTDREKEILVYLANGVSNKEMARRIFVSENTVKFHLKNIYSKLAVTSRLQAINAARQMGLLG